MQGRMTQGRWLWSLGIALLGIPPSGCMTRSISSTDDSALPREGRDAPQPVPLKNFLQDKEVRTTPGLFVSYSYRNKTYMLVQGKQLGKPFMLTAAVNQGTGRRGPEDVLGTLTGTLLQDRVVMFVRHGNRLYLMEQPHAYLDQKDAWTSVQRTFSPTVIASIPILAEDRSEASKESGKEPGKESARDSGKRAPKSKESTRSGDVLVGLDELLLEDLFASATIGRDHQKAARKLSFVEGVSGTTQSTSLRVRLGYQVATVTELGHAVNSIGITYSFLQLPAMTMQRRAADDRIGTFVTHFRDFRSKDPKQQSHAVTRWRLEPHHREGSLLVPVRPIVFYLDPATPKAYQPYILDGIRQWNRAFEAAGWKDAVRAALLPSKTALDDPRLAVIHWDVGEHSLGGRGSPIVDPRSGEILSATLILSHSPVREGLRQRRTFWGTSDIESPSTALDQDDDELSAVLGQQGDVLRALLLSQKVILPSDSLPDPLIGQKLRYIAMHEVGHALGLRHNFRASTLCPSDKLGDPKWLKQSPSIASVMDYPAMNLPSTPSDVASSDFPYYPLSIGPSDLLSIAYAYSPDPLYVAGLASQAAQWGYVFGSDEEASLGADPSVQRWDLGSEPLLWAKERTQKIKELWLALSQGTLRPGDRPTDVTQIARSLLHDYRGAVQAVPSYIGGRYGSRDHIGDAAFRPAMRPVEKSKQSAALSFLLSDVFAESTLPITALLAQQLGEDYLTSSRLTGQRQAVVPLWRQVLELRIQVLSTLLSPLRLRRMVDGEQAFGRDAVLSVGELLTQLTQSLCSEVLSASSVPISPLRRELQLRYIERLSQLVLHAEPESQHARAQARYQLQLLDGKLDDLKFKRSQLDVDTRAHLSELADAISSTLSGSRVIHPLRESRMQGGESDPM